MQIHERCRGAVVVQRLECSKYRLITLVLTVWAYLIGLYVIYVVHFGIDVVPKPLHYTTFSRDTVRNVTSIPRISMARETAAETKQYVAPPKITKQSKVILFWTTFYFSPEFEFGFGRQPFIDAECRVTNCITTNDKSQSGHANAILFHMRNVNEQTTFPAHRLQHQRYVFFLLEHPYNQWNDLRKYDEFFNLTMTYRMDSDIKARYGQVVPRTSNMAHVPRIQNKKRLVAWMVSNCNTWSKRELYVNELQKYIPVSIYGKCGNLTCRDSKCYNMIEANYKFYLSFENNVCRDYVTEKLFNILKYDIVPIVYGGTTYSMVTPPHSVIDIRDYRSPKSLAQYLLHLDMNDAEYIKYFQWKDKFVSQTKESDKHLLGFCDLCEILHNSSYPRKSYDIDSWWDKSNSCNERTMIDMKTKGQW